MARLAALVLTATVNVMFVWVDAACKELYCVDAEEWEAELIQSEEKHPISHSSSLQRSAHKSELVSEKADVSTDGLLRFGSGWMSRGLESVFSLVAFRTVGTFLQ